MGLLDEELRDIIGAELADVFLDATLTRDVRSASSDPAEPGASTTNSYSCKAIRDSYSVAYRDRGLVETKDVKIVILQTSLAVTPQSLDRITISGMGGPWTIVSDGAGQPAVQADPANAIWECRART